MTNLLDITGYDIYSLDDSDLRHLIGLLCEADFRKAGLGVKGIEFGGDQNAKDGGLDVVVDQVKLLPGNGFIPRLNTGFQVKKPDMSRSEILKEMKPKGILRDSIKKLISIGGAYVIVSSGSNCSTTAKAARLKAMEEAISDEPLKDNLSIEFYDRGQIASWVRLHPSLILWVLNKIGRGLQGWYPYQNWSNTPDIIQNEYFVDDKLKFHEGRVGKITDGMSVEQGIIKIRAILSIPGKSIRLVGLSGVGKTRLAQALFDDNIFQNSLNPYLVYYADVSDNLNPDPKTFAEHLIAHNAHGQLIVDNCPPDLHRKLTDVCIKSNSNISLLTIEYDIKDDQPENTHVFTLDSSSSEIIERLIRKQFPHISGLNSRTIPRLSEGNARLAIALANGLDSREDLSSLNDDQLFRRLLFQRHPQDKDLYASAQVCSLVYSFNGNDISSEYSEIRLLASFVNKMPEEIFRNISILEDRGLVQRRGEWAAILPHPISNKLAKSALKDIHKDIIVNKFLECGSERLIRSFARRLSFLHDCDIAVKIADQWLSSDGWIGENCGKFSRLGIDIFKLIAPVSPDKSLAAMELAAQIYINPSFTSRNNIYYLEFVQVLCRLSYEERLFARSVNLLCLFALSESPTENQNSTRDRLRHLFSIHLSGTHTTAATRNVTIVNLLDSHEDDKQQLGLFLLDSALETSYFEGDTDMSFGARPRDDGYKPETEQDVHDWYTIFIGCCMSYAISNLHISTQSKKLLSKKIRGLWTYAKMFDEIETLSTQLHDKGSWNDGWAAICEIIKFDGERFDADTLKRLKNLEQLLRPRSLLEKTRIYVLSGRHFYYCLEYHYNDHEDQDCIPPNEKIEDIVYDLGLNVAKDVDTLQLLLPEICSANGLYLVPFGKGLADGCSDKEELWKKLCIQFSATASNERSPSVMLGYLSACFENSPEFYHSTMDKIIYEPVLNEYFPIFQTSSIIDKKAIDRLLMALDSNSILTSKFKYIAYGRKLDVVHDDDLALLLEKIINKEDGIDVAVDILSFKFGNHEYICSEKLMQISRQILSTYSFLNNDSQYNNSDFELAKIAKVVLKGEAGRQVTKIVCNNLVHFIKNNRNRHIYIDLMNVVAMLHPRIFLDLFLASDVDEFCLRQIFHVGFETASNNPLNKISDQEIISWSEVEPLVRYPKIISSIQPFLQIENSLQFEWRSIVYLILDKSTSLNIIFECLYEALIPRSYAGYKSNIMQSRAVLFEQLFDHDIENVRTFANQKYSLLLEEIKTARESESSSVRQENEKFEY